ncbi:hypothetical protein TEA_011472 [Camellia sinensis var. sinensis]|uniref:TPR1-like CTLH-containing domain-containing protein n=1 Tax=Camellia sinensis var. sinensis TaxID=542762 RepID=A0A4S4DJE5_CAMSN|nr:hypothetical protein TEA_011472 [Camellia sinensis var. sinensis]
MMNSKQEAKNLGLKRDLVFLILCDHVAAIAIFVNELKLFSAFNEDVFNDLTKLLTLDDFRDLIKANVVFHNRLNFPNLADSRSQNLINQRGHDGVTKTIPSGSSDKTKQIVCSLDGCASPVLNITDELPMIVIRTLTQGSCVLTMGFRPILPMVEAHIGSVNDLAFASTSENLSIVTDGVDKLLSLIQPNTASWLPEIWEMDSKHLLATSDVGEDLTETSCACFNKEGTLLAASVRNNRIKILGTFHGIQSLQAYEMHVSIIATKNGDQRSSKDVPKTVEVIKPIKTLKIKEIRRLAQIQPLPLLGSVKMAKAKTKNPPQLWHPKLGTLMTNDLTNVRTEVVKPHFALSKNDFNLISTYGGQVSLFNISTFERTIRLAFFQLRQFEFLSPSQSKKINWETVRNRGSVSARSETLPCHARVETCYV